MGLKNKMAEKMLGSATTKAMQNLVPLLESIHTHMELQVKYQEEILKSIDKENGNDKVKKIHEEIIK